MAAQPRITGRATWRASRPIPGGRGVALSSRRWVVAHYPVMSSRSNHQWARDIERVHLNQGWAVIGYNFLIGMDGEIIEGCGRDIRGIHSPPRNTDGFGVCYLQPSTPQGALTAPLSQAARNSGRALYEWLSSVCGRRLGMSWHGQHFATSCAGRDVNAWVQGGMQAQTPGPGPSPPPQPPPPTTEEIEMVATAMAANGNFHVFVVGQARQTVWLTFQRPNENNWHGGQPGQRIAGLFRFADAPQGRTIRGISAEKTQNGTLHVFCTLDDGSTVYTWQRANSHEWSGGQAGQRVAALSAFAPRP